MKKFFGQIGRIKPECIEEYCRLHEVDVYTEKWAGVLQLIRDCNIQNYNIFIEDDVVFGYYEYVGEDYEADMAKMAADPTTQKWWDIVKPLMEPLADRAEGEFWSDMNEVYHLD